MSMCRCAVEQVVYNDMQTSIFNWTIMAMLAPSCRIHRYDETVIKIYQCLLHFINEYYETCVGFYNIYCKQHVL